MQALKEQLGARGGVRKEKSMEAAEGGPLEIRVALRGLLFKMDHHPMEV